jgi:hypothetical protein
MIEQGLAVLINAGADRFRGAGGALIKSDIYASFMFAAAIALLFPLEPWQVLAAAVLYKLGESSGWGEPLGSIIDHRTMREEFLEWWQVGPLAKSIPLAMMFRGAMWALPISAFFWYYIDPTLAIITMLTWSFTFWLIVEAVVAAGVKHAWEVQEELRGALFMIPIAAFSYFS